MMERVRRWIRRLIGHAPGNRLVERGEVAAARDRAKTAAIAEATRGNMAHKGPGSHPRDW
jgi:hypothetical protein